MPEELINEESSVVLVGEAAHPLMASFFLLFLFYHLGIYNLYTYTMDSVKAFMARRWW